MRREVLACGLVTLAAALPAAGAELLIFDCSSADRQQGCRAAGDSLQVEITDGGARRVVFIFSHRGSASFAVDRIHIEDARGVLVGPPDVLNKEPGVSFRWNDDKQRRIAVSAGARTLKIHPDLTVTAQSTGSGSGLNAGESLGLVYEIAGGLDLNDVLRDLRTGALAIAAGTIEVPAATDAEGLGSERRSEGGGEGR